MANWEIDLTKTHYTTADLLREACDTSKDKTFFHYIPRKSKETYGQFADNVNRMSNLLEKTTGIGKGSMVCTMSENSPELLHTFSAITNIGAVWVPINGQLIGESLRYIIDVSDANHVCTSATYRDLVSEAIVNIKRPVQILSIEELAEKSKKMAREYRSPTHPDDIACIVYTSGTTGFPKGVMHTHNSVIRTGIRALEVVETTPDDQIHVYLPFFHAWAYLIMLGTLYFKATMVIDEKFNIQTYWDNIETYRITQDHWTGTVPVSLMKLPKSEVEQRIKMNVFGTFGALYESMKERWPNLRFQSLYGQTEHPCATSVPADRIFPGSDGIPKSPDEILIMDETGVVLPHGEVGEIVVRCRCGVRFKEYYKNPEATAETIKGEDLHTGDLGYLDNEGHLHFSGRKKDALRVRGEMVSVEHIELLINGHSGIAESAIVGYRPPEKEKLKEDEIVAHLVLKPDETMSAEKFNVWSEKNLARFMRPKYVVFRESLPKTATNRIQRFKVREEGILGATKLF